MVLIALEPHHKHLGVWLRAHRCPPELAGAEPPAPAVGGGRDGVGPGQPVPWVLLQIQRHALGGLGGGGGPP